jgi:hypothetical protein
MTIPEEEDFHTTLLNSQYQFSLVMRLQFSTALNRENLVQALKKQENNISPKFNAREGHKWQVRAISNERWSL